MKDKNPSDVVVSAELLHPVLSQLTGATGVFVDVIAHNIIEGEKFLNMLRMLKVDLFQEDTELTSDTLRSCLSLISAWGIDDTRFEMIKDLLLAKRGFHLEISKILDLLEGEGIIPEGSKARTRVPLGALTLDTERDSIDGFFHDSNN